MFSIKLKNSKIEDFIIKSDLKKSHCQNNTMVFQQIEKKKISIVKSNKLLPIFNNIHIFSFFK
jgi:hypothetical protein